MNVKAVVFDLGKVLVDFDYGIAARSLAAGCGQEVAQIRPLIDGSPLLFRYESAGINSREFYDEFRQASGYPADFDTFAGCFADIFSEIPAMVRFHEELRAAGVPTYILSNTNEIAIRHIRRNFPFFANFSGYVLSYEQRALKPHREIYEAAERMIGHGGAELVFIDDRPENVAGAAALGWHVIEHRDPAETIPFVRGLLSRS